MVINFTIEMTRTQSLKNQILFVPIKPSNSNSRIKPNQSEDSGTGFDKDVANQSSFTPKRSSNPKSRIKQSQSDDSDTRSYIDMVNQRSFEPKS